MRRLAPLLIVSLAGCGSVEYGGGSIAYGASEATYTMAAPTAIGASPAAPGDSRVEIEVFLQELAPYGQWMEHPQYGNLFLPHDAEYRPYQNGHWAQSADELVWVSYDAIGWAVCHYGSWTVLEDGRWAWVPGTEWSPAWVEWRETEQYVGWAPRMVGYDPGPTAWIFVETTYLLYDSVYYYAVEPSYLPTVYATGRPLGHRPGQRWLRDRGVRRATGRSVAVRPDRGPPARAASARGVVVRDGIPDATGRSVSVRGPARAPLVEGRPRETVVLGRRLPRETVYTDQRGWTAPPVAIDRPVAAPPPRDYGARPMRVDPPPSARVVPERMAPRVYATPSAPRRMIVQEQPRYEAPPQARMEQPRYEAPPRMVVPQQQPRYEAPARVERQQRPQAQPQQRAQRREEPRVQQQQVAPARAFGGPGVSVRRR